MNYSIIVENATTGTEEVFKGSDVNDVLHRACESVVNIKKKRKYNLGDEIQYYELDGKELRNLINETAQHIIDKNNNQIKIRTKERSEILSSILDKYSCLEQSFTTSEKNFKTYINDLDNTPVNQELLNKTKEAIESYFNNLLKLSVEKNDFYEKEIYVTFNLENKILMIDYRLPGQDDVSPVREINYVKSKDRFEEKYLKKSEYSYFYDNILYQITLRCIYEVFKNDNYNSISAVCFNGFVQTIDRSKGFTIRPFIISILVNKEEFLKVNLREIEAKSCFKGLKGISAGSLSQYMAIAPILTMDKNDKRFTETRNLVNNLDEKMNLALMDWQDFEHLICELFEKEFRSLGGEVRVTRASRDGGVDAIAFDPDPIRGGKIIIQAKRYSNTVGVSAVRDLYGTVMNEGANKGILVSTSDYGPEAYEFAKGKPLTLLNGSNLLYLLEKHGHSARIDLTEVKKLYLEKQQS